MGQALKELKWPRLNYVVSTKFYWGLDEGINRQNTLNRKYLSQAIDGSLQRMGLDLIDLVCCHRPDPQPPTEETVRAMSDMVSRGKALYRGTSEWPADDIRAAWSIADQHHLHKPVTEQPQYNMFHRKRVDQGYARLYEDIGRAGVETSFCQTLLAPMQILPRRQLVADPPLAVAIPSPASGSRSSRWVTGSRQTG